MGGNWKRRRIPLHVVYDSQQVRIIDLIEKLKRGGQRSPSMRKESEIIG